MLDRGELRRAIDSLTEDDVKRTALTVVVQERLLSVVFTPTGAGAAPDFAPRSLPYERFPALVEEASGLGVGSPQSWQLTADRLTGALTIRVSVTGPDGTASLETDARGRVIRRIPAS